MRHSTSRGAAITSPKESQAREAGASDADRIPPKLSSWSGRHPDVSGFWHEPQPTISLCASPSRPTDHQSVQKRIL